MRQGIRSKKLHEERGDFWDGAATRIEICGERGGGAVKTALDFEDGSSGKIARHNMARQGLSGSATYWVRYENVKALTVLAIPKGIATKIIKIECREVGLAIRQNSALFGDGKRPPRNGRIRPSCTPDCAQGRDM